MKFLLTDKKHFIQLKKGWFHVNEGQPHHPYSQILINLCSNVPTYEKQKWAKVFRLTLNGSWDISFWNLGNFRTFFSEIRHFEFSVSNEIVITNLNSIRPIFMKICTFVLFLGGESNNHIKNWPWAPKQKQV